MPCGAERTKMVRSPKWCAHEGEPSGTPLRATGGRGPVVPLDGPSRTPFRRSRGGCLTDPGPSGRRGASGGEEGSAPARRRPRRSNAPRARPQATSQFLERFVQIASCSTGVEIGTETAPGRLDLRCSSRRTAPDARRVSSSACGRSYSPSMSTDTNCRPHRLYGADERGRIRGGSLLPVDARGQQEPLRCRQSVEMLSGFNIPGRNHLARVGS
jgi:hypothetical protein